MVHAKVLVVDHEQGVYDGLKLGLAKRGYEMHTTTTMANALTPGWCSCLSSGFRVAGSGAR